MCWGAGAQYFMELPYWHLGRTYAGQFIMEVDYLLIFLPRREKNMTFADLISITFFLMMSSNCGASLSLQGFLNLKMKAWLRNFMTRSVAIIPSLVVAVISGSSGARKLIIISSV